MSFVITEPFQFIAGLDGEALDAGTIYYGEPNQDPIQYPKAVFYDALMTIPAPQPLRTVNGYIVRNGTPTMLFANGNYSVLVLDKLGRQVYFVADFLLIGNALPLTRAQVPFPVNTIADLRALDKSIYAFAVTQGYYAKGDGGAGRYYLDAADTVSADNGGTIIVATDGGRWKLVHNGTISSKQFGCRADGVTDDALQVNRFFSHICANGLVGTISTGNHLLKSPATIPITGASFTLRGAGQGSSAFTAHPTFSGGTAAITLTGNGTPCGWDIGGFSVGGSFGNTGTAVIGIQIGAPTPASIQILGYQFSTMRDVLVVDYATLYGIVHARMIRFIDCAGWAPGGSNVCKCVYITQNGSFTGDLIFDGCQYVSSTTTAGNYGMHISSPVGPFNPATGQNSIAGIKLTKTTFYQGDRTIRIDAQAGSYVADIWVTDGCQEDGTANRVVEVISTGASTIIEDLHFEGFYTNRSNVSNMDFSSDSTSFVRSVWISECQITGAQTQAVNFFTPTLGNITDIHVLSNTFVDCNNTIGSAIEVNGVRGGNIFGNRCRFGNGGQNPLHLVQLDSGVQNLYVAANNGAGITIGSVIQNNSGNSTNTIVDNPGYNPIPPAAVTVTASPFTYTNVSGAPQVVSVTGGTLTNVVIEGVTFPATSGFTTTLRNGGAISISYSSAPNVQATGL